MAEKSANPIGVSLLLSFTRGNIYPMRQIPLLFLGLLLSLAFVAPCQETLKAVDDQGFALGVNTYFDFGPPFDYYEIFVVKPAKEGSRVGKFTLTPPAHKCYAPEKTEYVATTTTLSVQELLAGVDPCKISEKDLKKEQKRKKKELNFSGANISLQITCGGATRTIKTSILERDWFLAHPGTPKNTNWTLELLSKLRNLTGPGVMDKPVLAMTETGPRPPLSADAESLESLTSGKYDPLFPGAQQKASEIYRASLISPPQPSVTLVSSTPEEPLHYTLPSYPPLPRLAAYEGQSFVILQLDARGNVASLQMSGGSPLFAGAVRDAVKDWKFSSAPPTMNLTDPPRQVTVTVSFQLN